jgi:hypothetical protein
MTMTDGILKTEQSQISVDVETHVSRLQNLWRSCGD